jgi:hypothetical protein
MTLSVASAKVYVLSSIVAFGINHDGHTVTAEQPGNHESRDIPILWDQGTGRSVRWRQRQIYHSQVSDAYPTILLSHHHLALQISIPKAV